jgi:sugar phosphate isomerase/epimerase
MRIGLLTRVEPGELAWIRQLGLGSTGWMGFARSPVATDADNWQRHADEVGARAAAHGVRISAIGALYQNPLDPRQTGYARDVFHRALEVAARLGIRTVSGFPGAVIETQLNERGGNPVYRPLEDFLPQVLAFWEPIARRAADLGLRLAFEHCPQGVHHLPVAHYNLFGQPALWERFFDACPCENVGLEWDPSHLICQFIDPVENLRRFGSRVFHVHAKDAFIDRQLLATYGVCHPGVAEHRFPGFGQADWPEIIHALVRAGYDSDLNIEGWHDPVFRDHAPDAPGPLAGRKLEEAGIRAARSTLQPLVQGLG